MPVSLEKPHPAQESLRQFAGRFADVRRAVVRAAPAISAFAATMQTLFLLLPEEGSDPSVSPDAMRWTPPPGEVPR